MSTRKSRGDEGSALVVTLLFLTVLMLLASALIFSTQGEMKSGAAYKRSQQAYYVANAGVQRAVSWFNGGTYNPHTPSTAYDLTTLPVKYSNLDVLLAGQSGSSSVYPDGTTSAAFSTQFTGQSIVADTNHSGVYAVNASLRSYTPVTFLDPTTFVSTPSGVERWTINALGFWGTVASPLGTARITATIENSGNALIDRALWGINSVDLTGTTFIDSYDPALGPYGGSNVGFMGSVGTNGVLTAGGTTTVNGDLLYGPGGSYNGGTNVTVSGSIIQSQEPHVFAPLPDFTAGSGNQNYAGFSTATLPAGTYGSISLVANAVVTFSGGDYYIDSLNIGGSARLVVSAASTLFIKNDLDAGGGGIVNTTGIPGNLMIFCAGDSAKLSGTSDFYGSVYAPNADLDITGTTQMFGGYVGLTVTNHGTANIHFDEGSLNRNLLRRPYRIITWAQDTF